MGYSRQQAPGHRRTAPTHSPRKVPSSPSLEAPEVRRSPDVKRTSEGRRPEAVLACLSYAGCSTLLTLANKAIFSEARLNYPWMLLGVQSIVVTLMLLVYYGAFVGAHPLIQRELLRELLLPCLFFTMFIFTNACALRHISLPVLTVVKSLAPMGVALAERAVFRERVSLGTYGAMALIISGNAVTVVHDIEFNATGYMWAGLNVIMNVAYVVSLRYCLSDKFSSGMKTLHSNVLACSFIFPMAIAAGEYPGFFVEFGQTSLRFRSLYLLSCVLAAGIGASVFWVIQTASGSTLSFVGAANKVFVVILGAILFDAKISPAGWVGVGMGTLAGLCFAIAKATAARAKAASDEAKVEVETDEESEISDETKIELLQEPVTEINKSVAN